MQVKSGNSILELIRGDITEQDTEAIVNAANCQLILGGGVAGVIRTKGGPAIQQECKKIGEIFVGGAVKTTGGNLKAKYVIHAVGPRMGEGDEDDKLKIKRCAEIMLGVVTDYLKGKTGLEKVVFCLFTKADYRIFEEQLSKEIGNESDAPEQASAGG